MTVHCLVHIRALVPHIL